MSGDICLSDDVVEKIKWDLLSVTEIAAVACYELIGRGDNHAADQAAVSAMRTYINKLNIKGRVAIGEGERDKAPMLYIGEELGMGGEDIDIAVDPLEGTTICAECGYGAMSVIAATKSGGFLHIPDIYMQKIAVGKHLQNAEININASAADNLSAIAKIKRCSIGDLTVVILKRERHKELIEEVRRVGAKIKLISDGDIAGVLTTNRFDMYLGIGGAPEGVLAAAALRCIGGKMQCKLVFRDNHERNRASSMDIQDFDRVYNIEDMVRYDTVFIATGVTDGEILHGVMYQQDKVVVHSVVMTHDSVCYVENSVQI